MAEDLRLLYVALTRAIYHCSVGIAPIIKGNRKKSGETDLHLSALGYLIQKGEAGDFSLLNKGLAELAGTAISVERIEYTESISMSFDQDDNESLSARDITRFFDYHWRVTSYSGLSYSSGHSGSGNEQAISAEQLATSLAPKIDVEASLDATLPEIDEFTLTPHLFPRGTAPGTFLHELMEEMDFSQEIPLNG